MSVPVRKIGSQPICSSWVNVAAIETTRFPNMITKAETMMTAAAPTAKLLKITALMWRRAMLHDATNPA